MLPVFVAVWHNKGCIGQPCGCPARFRIARRELETRLPVPMDRFFHSAGFLRPDLSLEESESHHAARVLRKQPGDTIELFDGRGQSALAEITTVKKDKVDVRIVRRGEPQIAPLPAIHLAVAPPKGDRFRWLVEKATELGVDRVIPLLTERTVVEPGAGKLDKLQAAVVAACKQSGRNLVMQVSENTPLVNCLGAEQTSASPRVIFIGDPHGEMFQPSVLPVGVGEVLLLVGPEGGWSEAELESATRAGARRIRIADQILRTETAAIQLAGLCVWARSLAGK
jgi:16S rRNA (uracil1498-N3)-methyltransferase